MIAATKTTSTNLHPYNCLKASVQYYIDKNEASENTKKWLFKHTTDAIYIAIFGCNQTKLKKILGIPNNEFLRDRFDAATLERLEQLEQIVAKGVIIRNMHPVEVVKYVVEKLNITVSAPTMRY